MSDQDNDHTYHQDNSGVPQYGTEEYNRWYRAKFGPASLTPTQPPQKKKRHITRWLFAGIGGFVVLIVVIAVATAGNSSKPAAHTAAATHHAEKPRTIPTQTYDNFPSDIPSDDPTEAPTPDGPTFDPIGSTLDYTETDNFDSSQNAEAHINATLVGTYTGPITQDEFGSNEAPHYGTYRVFKVTMRVLSGSIDDVDTTSFRWESSTHHVYNESEGNSYESGFNSDDELSWNGAAEGQTVTGELIFDVPPGAGKLELVNYDSSVVGGWTVG